MPDACSRMSGRAFTTPAWTRRAYTGSRTIPCESTPRSSALIRHAGHFARVRRRNVEPLQHAAAEVEQIFVPVASCSALRATRSDPGTWIYALARDRLSPSSSIVVRPSRSLLMISDSRLRRVTAAS